VKLFFLLLALAIPSQTLFASNIRDFFAPAAPAPPPPRVQWRGYTAATYQGGAVGGGNGAAAKCEADHAGSHPCTSLEIWTLGTAYPATSAAWVIDGHAIAHGVSAATYTTSTWPGENARRYLINTSDYTNCNSWSTNNGFYSGAYMSGRNFQPSRSCNNTHKLPCCE